MVVKKIPNLTFLVPNIRIIGLNSGPVFRFHLSTRYTGINILRHCLRKQTENALILHKSDHVVRFLMIICQYLDYLSKSDHSNSGHTLTIQIPDFFGTRIIVKYMLLLILWVNKPD